MTLKQIQYILAVAKCGSISQAAKELYVAQSSLSATIKQLEEEYQIRLFERTGKGVSITSQGMEFLQDIRFITDFYQAVEEKYKSPRTTGENLFIASHHHTEAIDAFTDLLGESTPSSVRFGYFEGGTQFIIDNLESGLAEIGVLYFTQSSSNVMMKECNKRDLTFHHIRYSNIHAYIHRNHPLARLSAVSLQTLADYPFLSYDQMDEASRRFTSEIRQWQQNKRVILISDRAMAYSLASSGYGYFTGSGHLSREEYSRGLLAIPITDLDNIEVGWVQKTYRTLSAPANEFVKRLMRYSYSGRSRSQSPDN